MSKFQNVHARTNTHNGPKSLYGGADAVKTRKIATSAGLRTPAEKKNA